MKQRIFYKFSLTILLIILHISTVLRGGRASFKKLNAKRDNVKNITIHKVSRVQ